MGLTLSTRGEGGGHRSWGRDRWQSGWGSDRGRLGKELGASLGMA